MTMLGPNGQPIAQRDPRLDRCKICPVPMVMLIQLLNARDGAIVPKVVGWPDDDEASVIAMNLQMHPEMGPIVVFTLYSPNFPIVLQQPPIMPLTGDWRKLPDAFSWDDLLPLVEPEANDAAT